MCGNLQRVAKKKVSFKCYLTNTKENFVPFVTTVKSVKYTKFPQIYEVEIHHRIFTKELTNLQFST